MKGRTMTTVDPSVSRAPGVPTELHRLRSMTVPRWLRQRRRAEWAAARPAGLAEEIAGRLGTTRPAGEPTLRELLADQQIRPFDPDRHRAEARLSADDWAELRAALAEGRDGD